MMRLIAYAALGAAGGAGIAYLLADGLAEGAFIGAMLGASIGVIIAMRRASGPAGPSFEYEAAGIHDDNLITTARRNLVREAHRDTFGSRIIDEKIEQSGSAETRAKGSRPERR